MRILMAINEFMAHFEGKQVLPPLLPNVSADCGADDNPHLAAARTSDQRERERERERKEPAGLLVTSWVFYAAKKAISSLQNCIPLIGLFWRRNS